MDGSKTSDGAGAAIHYYHGTYISNGTLFIQYYSGSGSHTKGTFTSEQESILTPKQKQGGGGIG